jgi:hypothetical protein
MPLLSLALVAFCIPVCYSKATPKGVSAYIILFRDVIKKFSPVAWEFFNCIEKNTEFSEKKTI